MSEAAALRLDRWLWHARFVRSRESVVGLIEARRVRINSQVVTKTHALVRPGDVLTLSHQPDTVRVLRVRDLGRRRGPATEAASLYDDLTVG